MNSSKNNSYKNAIYFLSANALIVLAGFIVMLVCGLNLNTSVSSGHLIFASSFSIVISLVIILIYIGLRYDFLKAFSVIVTAVHNVLLSTALVAIIRVPVSETLIMGYVLLIGITTIFTLILTEKMKGIDLKKANYSEIIKSAISQSIKQIVVVSAIIIALMLLGLIIASQSMFDFARIFSVMILVVIYSSLTISLPLWCFFSSKIKKIKKSTIDKNVEDQKLATAVPVEEVKTDGEGSKEDLTEEKPENE